MQQITHPNHPRPTSPPHAVNPASRLIIQINFCRAQDRTPIPIPIPIPFVAFILRTDGEAPAGWVAGFIAAARLRAPAQKRQKKTRARI
jgi:hypothetical protein